MPAVCYDTTPTPHLPVALIEMIIVDCYNHEEAITAFLTVFDEEVVKPTSATVLATPVEVLAYEGQGDPLDLVARCRAGDTKQWLSLCDIVFEPGTSAAWIHAAYRRWLGLRPHSAVRPADWSGIDWLR